MGDGAEELPLSRFCLQPSSASGPEKQVPGAYQSPWRVPARQKLHLRTARTARAGSPMSSRSQVGILLGLPDFPDQASARPGRRQGSQTNPSPGPLQFLCPISLHSTLLGTCVSRAELDLGACLGLRSGWGCFPRCCPVLELALTGLLSPGDYEVSIKFNDEHIPDSPFVVPVASLSDDARRLTVTSLQVCARGGWGPPATLRDGQE